MTLELKTNDELKQKQKKNYILDNKNKIQEIQPKQIKGEDQPSTHKNFGKVPEQEFKFLISLQKYKSDIEEKKENE